MRANRAAFIADMAVKAALVVAVLVLALWPDLRELETKELVGRTFVYPLSILVVPIGWWLVERRRGRPVAYPYALDILVVAPFLIETLGALLGLSDSVRWWDDANHFIASALFTAAFGVLLLRVPLGRLVTAALMIGFGAVTAILWEFAEYTAGIHEGTEELTAYARTLGDLALSLAAACLAALVTAWFLWPRAQTSS